MCHLRGLVLAVAAACVCVDAAEMVAADGVCEAGDDGCQEAWSMFVDEAVSHEYVRFPDESNGLPVFNLAKFHANLKSSGDKAPGQSAAMYVLQHALKHKGIFYIDNTGADIEALTAKVRDSTIKVFELPPDEAKKLVRNTSPVRGLATLESESVAQLLGSGNHTDLCAKWTMGNSAEVENVWPEGDDEFKEAWTVYHDHVHDSAKYLVEVFAHGLGLQDIPSWKSVMNTPCETNIRLLWYPDVRPERCADQGPPERMAAHHDLDLVTLIHQTPAKNGFVSLQGQFVGSEAWVDVPVVPGTLVVTCGEVLSIISGGLIKATTHRVAVPHSDQSQGSARTSIALFYQPHPNFLVKPLADTDFDVSQYEFPPEGLAFRKWHELAFANLKSA